MVKVQIVKFVLQIVKFILFSQACVILVVFLKSVLPFVDVIVHHFTEFVIDPYLELLWSSLAQWVFIYYVSIPVALAVLIRTRPGHKFLQHFVIFCELILLSQVLILVMVILKSILPFIDNVITHTFNLIVKPYLALIWHTLMFWTSVYISVIFFVVYYNRSTTTAPRDVAGQNIKQEDVQLPPSTDSHWLINLTEYSDRFVELVNLDTLTPILCQNGVLHNKDLDDMLDTHRGVVSRTFQILHFVTILDKKGKDGLLGLIGALQEDKSHLGHAELAQVLSAAYGDLALESHQQPSRSSSSNRSTFNVEVVDGIFHNNQSDSSENFGWSSFKDAVCFHLKKGWLTAELLGSSSMFELPPNFELVSPLVRVTVSPGAEASLDIFHCAELQCDADASDLRVAGTQVNFLTENPRQLSCTYKNGMFSREHNYGRVELPSDHTQPCSCHILGIVRSRKDSSSAVTPIPPTPPLLGYRYQQAVFYQLLYQEREEDIRQWKVHIIPFKDMQGFHESVINLKFPPQEYLTGLPTKPFVLQDEPLSLGVSNPFYSKWKIEEKQSVDEVWFGMRYKHFMLEVKWTGHEKTSPSDFKCDIKWNGIKETKTKLKLSPKGEYEALRRNCSEQATDPRRSTWRTFMSRVMGK